MKASPWFRLAASLPLWIPLAACAASPGGNSAGRVAASGPPLAHCVPGESALRAETRLQSLLDGFLAQHPSAVGVSLHVEAPKLCLSWSGASGLRDASTGQPLTPETPFRLASVTKTFTAASVLRLVEEGRLSLDDPIGRRLPEPFVELLESDGYDVDSILLRHALTHTAGLYNYAATRQYGVAVFSQFEKRWTPFEQIQYAVRFADPLGAPGTVYQYSDTGFVLLGQVIEKATGEPLAAAFRRLLDFKGLGLDSTWMESQEPEPAGVADRAHQYYGAMDTYRLDPSGDLFGGGGLVATSADLARFQRALLKGRVYRKPETLQTMLTTVITPLQGNYRMGIEEFDVDGETGWGHRGFWTVVSFCFPESDITIAGSVQQVELAREGDQLVRDAYRIAKAP